MLEFEFHKLSYKPYFEKTDVQWCTVVQRSAQERTGAHRVRKVHIFPYLIVCKAKIWYEGLNLNFINFLIHHLLRKKQVCSGA